MRDPAKVVALEVDQHDVLGALFVVVDELAGQAQVILLVLAARARASDRTRPQDAVLELHEQLRRAGDEGEACEAQQAHVRRGIDDAQRLVDLLRRRAQLPALSHGQVDLEHVTLGDVGLDALHRSHVRRLCRTQARCLRCFRRRCAAARARSSVPSGPLSGVPDQPLARIACQRTSIASA